MLVWKTLHILSMVTMVSVFIGAEIFYAAAILRRDVRALAWVQRTVEATGAGIIAIAGLALGIVFGLVVMLQHVVDSRHRNEASDRGVRTPSIVEVEVAG